MAFPRDDNFEEDSGVFHPESPTVAEGRRARKRQLAQDPNYQHGRIIRAIIELRHDVDEINAHRITVAPSARPSMRPHVATAGISATAGGIIVAIFEMLRAAGVIK
jgi:hypothetical protein